MPAFNFPALTPALISWVLIIFVLRIIGSAITTIRTLFVMRGRRWEGAILAFIEALIFALTLGAVVQNLSNVWNLFAYCLGFAAGQFVGMAIEEKLALGYASLRIVSKARGRALANAIREAGFGATEDHAEGRQGTVGVITVTVRRKEIESVNKIIEQTDTNAFVTIEEARALRRGYLRIGGGKPPS
jgi:uncharacterized protein YebE (UPF0316 family)